MIFVSKTRQTDCLLLLRRSADATTTAAAAARKVLVTMPGGGRGAGQREFRQCNENVGVGKEKIEGSAAS